MKGQRVLVWLPVRGDRYASFFKEKNAATLVLIFWLKKKRWNLEVLASEVDVFSKFCRWVPRQKKNSRNPAFFKEDWALF